MIIVKVVRANFLDR